MKNGKMNGVVGHIRRQKSLGDLDEAISYWFAVRVSNRWEKKVAKCLRDNGIEVYLPLLEVRRIYSGRVRRKLLPLIRSFVFVRIVKSQYLTVLRTPGVAGFLKLAGQLKCVKDSEIEVMRLVVGESSNVELLSERPVLGDRVKIMQGGLAGIEGHLVEIKGKNCFVVQLASIGGFLKVEVNPAYLLKQ